MIAYTIEAALESKVFDQVFVSTEDPLIGASACRWGAKYHPRPEELAGDLVSATDVCLEVHESLGGTSHSEYDVIYCLQPSSPLRTGQDVELAWEAFCSSGADYLVSMTFVDPHYFHWALRQQEDGWQMYFGDQYMKERLLLPPVYRPNGAIKIARAEVLHQRRNFFGPNLATYAMPEERSVHVAEQFDFELAEFLFGRRKGDKTI